MLADFGEDMKAWSKASDGRAMYGFILCSDNRWQFHPVCAEMAMDAFDRRLKTARTREIDRIG